MKSYLFPILCLSASSYGMNDQLLALVQQEVVTVEQVQELLAKGAEVDATDPLLNTPLMLALLKGHPAISEELIAQGADTKRRNVGGKSSLHISVERDNVAVAKLILEDGYQEEEERCYVNGPLTSALLNDSPKMVRLLMTNIQYIPEIWDNNSYLSSCWYTLSRVIECCQRCALPKKRYVVQDARKSLAVCSWGLKQKGMPMEIRWLILAKAQALSSELMTLYVHTNGKMPQQFIPLVAEGLAEYTVETATSLFKAENEEEWSPGIAQLLLIELDLSVYKKEIQAIIERRLRKMVYLGDGLP